VPFPLPPPKKTERRDETKQAINTFQKSTYTWMLGGRGSGVKHPQLHILATSISFVPAFEKD